MCREESCQECCTKCHKRILVITLPLYLEKPSMQDLHVTYTNLVHATFGSLNSIYILIHNRRVYRMCR